MAKPTSTKQPRKAAPPGKGTFEYRPLVKK